MPQTAQRRPAARRRRRRRRHGKAPLVLIPVLIVLCIVGFYLLKDDSAPTAPENPEWITQDFLPRNQYSRPGTALDAVNGIVVHYVGNPGTTAEQNHSFFAGLARSGETYASSHFLIGLEGEIIQNVPLDEVAYCSNDRNHDTLSIECCHPDDTGEFTPETYDALVKLVRWLMEYYELDASQVIRHYDVSGKECPRYYVQNPDAWAAFLTDLVPEE